MTTHPALTRAQAVHDEPRDLVPAEQKFLTVVHRITMECARTKGEAIRCWGDGSQAYEATAYMANRREQKELTVALEAFELDIEADDEVEEVAAAMVEHQQAAE